MSYRIAEYYAENFKRLKLVQIEPKGRVVKITGRNGQGKTSVLDVIPFVLGGKKYSPDAPVRKGAKHMKCSLVVKGEEASFTATRTQAGFTLEMAKGCKAWATPQAMLDSIFDELSFDPLEFIRLGDTPQGRRQQVEMVRKAVKVDLDFDALNLASQQDAAARRDVNVQIRELEGQLAGITVQEGLPEELIDVAAIEKALAEVNARNRNLAVVIEQRKALEKALAEAQEHAARNAAIVNDYPAKIMELGEALEKVRAEVSWLVPVMEMCDAWSGHYQDVSEAAVLQAQIRSTFRAGQDFADRLEEKEKASELALDTAQSVLEAARAQHPGLETTLEAARAALEAAPRAEVEDTAWLLEDLKHSQGINREIERKQRRDELKAKRNELERESTRLRDQMDEREEQKRRALAEAKLPVAGMAVTEADVLVDGVPLNQLGEAEQIKVCVQLILARDPKLRLVRIPHGEALDDQAWAELEKMAEEMDFYIWAAKVDPSGTVGIVIEDGEVKAVQG